MLKERYKYFLTNKYLYEYWFCIVERVAQVKSTSSYLTVHFGLLVCTYISDCLNKERGRVVPPGNAAI